MAEYIERGAALSMREPPKSNRYYQTDNLDDAYGQGWDDALCCIERLPAADVIPVVRCKECEYAKDAKVNSKGFCICPASHMEITDDDFCSYGERKANERT